MRWTCDRSMLSFYRLLLRNCIDNDFNWFSSGTRRSAVGTDVPTGGGYLYLVLYITMLVLRQLDRLSTIASRKLSATKPTSKTLLSYESA
jgi:hypothetical protein